jgi:ABC-type lipoprotein export system ATPase subunit
MSNDTPLLQLKNISREFPSAEGGEPLKVLRGLSMEVARGESIAVVGPSGCGKSTLLNLIGTLDQPTGGTITLDGRDLGELNDDELALLRNREMGFIFQSHHLLPQCTVMENVLVPTLAHGRATDDDEERARRLLDRVGLGERLSHRPGQLSGGERQRVAVVRALINEPQLLLADEPTGALDQATADQLGQLLIELNAEENVTLITVTHSEKLATQMTRTVELKDGRIDL